MNDEDSGVDGWDGQPTPSNPWGDLPPPPAQQAPAGDYPGGQGWQDIQALGADGGPPPQRQRLRIGSVLRYGVVAVVAGGALLGWLGSASRDGDGEISKAGELAAADLRVGDCFDEPGEADEVDAIRALPCSEPHDLEVFHEFAHPDADAPPSMDVAVQRIGEECIPAFDAFVGIAYEDSELDFFTFEPTPSGWRMGDRTVTCAVYAMDGSKLTGSVRGTRR